MWGKIVLLLSVMFLFIVATVFFMLRQCKEGSGEPKQTTWQSMRKAADEETIEMQIDAERF